MRLLALASTVTSSTALMALLCTRARVSPRITLRADTPAPLTPTPVAPPSAMAIDAARPKTWMSASDSACTVTLVLELSTAPSSDASTEPSMMLRAKETPTDTATPMVPPKAADKEAAPAKDRIEERSVAWTKTPSASTVLLRSAVSVVTPACTRVPIWFSAQTPEPLRARPVVPPAATAAEPDTTKASMTWRASARRSSQPAALTSESLTRARTVAMALSPSMPKPSWPIRLRATAMPMDAPRPVLVPTPTATDKAAMVALMVLSLDALSTTSPSAVAELARNKASVEPLMVLTATAPAPLKARPDAEALMPMAAEAATETALMLLRLITALNAADEPAGATLKVRV